ncbi:MAG: adenosylcobalamin-dependent ribonucleoside-diphosphate reductase [Candidatus Liptonbacteria bacterium]|nr:adenosylcobalamin-dependent ribonucleoside-diphosphate reductase [Candidatus Liptonbacteria bacterium]
MLSKNTVKKINKNQDKKWEEKFSENALEIMKKRYFLIDEQTGKQETFFEMVDRVSGALAEAEKKYGGDQKFIEKTKEEFFEVMANKEFVPAGRTLANAGSSTALIANCVVLPVCDSMEEIFQTLKEASLLQQTGCGLGFDFSELRPAMTPTKRSRGFASGPVSFIQAFNQAFLVIKQQNRHGANMALLSVEHPDILDFISCKKKEGALKTFNISIKITDKFINQFLKNPNKQWYCVWKDKKTKPRRIIRDYHGDDNSTVIGSEEVDITAKELFDQIVEYAWLNGEPGVIFIDEINRKNTLPGLGLIQATNPCGEQPLHPYDNCNLGAINLGVFVKNQKIDYKRLKKVTGTAVKMLDNVIDLFNFPVDKLNEVALKNRKIGLGIMGFADMLYQLNIKYGSKESLKIVEKTMQTIQEAAYETSQKLAEEKGNFPNWHLSIFAKKKIKIRNSSLTTIAPTGSTSMIMDASSGMEPNFALAYVKQDKDNNKYNYFNVYFEKALKSLKLNEKKIEEIKQEVIKKGSVQHLSFLPKKFRDIFVVAMDLTSEEHIKMQAAFQKYVDSSISKTINFKNEATKEDVAKAYILAWKLKCKGCTVYRDESRSVQILTIGDKEKSVNKKDEAITQSPGVQEQPLKVMVDKTGIYPRKRPMALIGKTYRIKTGYGNLYITINNDENGLPFEIFATIGKSGGFFQEQTEGVCRLISLALRCGIKIEEIVSHLKGIRGPMPVISENGTILSLPDAIGRALEEHVKLNGNLKSPMELPLGCPSAASVALPGIFVGAPKEKIKKSLADYGEMPECPECNFELILSEGCMNCMNCGYSRCS